MKYTINTTTQLSDKHTLVGLYLKLRDRYNSVMLLETSTYATKEDSLSFIVFNSQAKIEVKDGVFTNRGIQKKDFDIREEIKNFIEGIEINSDDETAKYNAILGFSGYDAVQEFEDIEFDASKSAEDIPQLRYDFYRHMIVFDHFHERMHLIDYVPEGESSELQAILKTINNRDLQTFTFRTEGDGYSNMSDQEYMDMVTKGKQHCQRGDVFQIVLARKYYQKYKGDDFNVYRALRSINPSPYLFYFDYSDFRIFGSSPEAQLIVKNKVAEIHPIAGTFRRTGDMGRDQELAVQLENDPKETAEHVMLVDLARNDLSRNTNKVVVDKYKEVQYFSHVIHLVSRVTGELKREAHSFDIFADTFPAGTLSGAPKYKAMQLINSYEKNARSYYGGGIGLLFFNGDLNHAIMIRSFLSKGGVLIRQAGAGIVIDSVEEKELQEVNNKLAALENALNLAQNLNS